MQVQILFSALVVCFVQTGVAQHATIKTDEISRVVHLPNFRSNVYPDTFAIFWVPYKAFRSDSATQSISFSITDEFDNELLVSPFIADTLAPLTFETKFAEEARLLIITWRNAVGERLVDNPGWKIHPKQIAILNREPEVEDLRISLFKSYTFENLRVLAEAFENRRCYVNAYYIYRQMLQLNRKAGMKAFQQFLVKNSENLYPTSEMVQR